MSYKLMYDIVQMVKETVKSTRSNEKDYDIIFTTEKNGNISRYYR